MDFELTPQQRAFQQRMADFASDALGDDVQRRDRDSTFSIDLWRKCADFGILGMNLPQQYGGQAEVDVLTAVIGMEALGYGCRDRGLLLALNAQLWSVQLPILKLGTEQQKAEILPKLASGTWKAAHAVSEPEAGSDAFGIQTVAQQVEGGFLLSGRKCMITLAPLADIVLLTAVTDPNKGKWGISSFLVERSFEGYTASEPDAKMGLRTVPFGEIELQNCFVPQTHQLGSGQGDVIALQALLEVERCCLLASHIGAMEYQLEQTIKYARARKQFGQSIGGFQSVSNRIADMKVRLETARLLLRHVAWLKSTGASAVAEAAMLKLYLSEAFVESSLDAMRVHGGRGYMSQWEVEREMRDALGGIFYAGTSDIQRNIIAKMLGVG